MRARRLGRISLRVGLTLIAGCLWPAGLALASEVTSGQWQPVSTQPLRFEPNLGQFDPEVGFRTRAAGLTVDLGWTDIQMTIAAPDLGSKLEGSAGALRSGLARHGGAHDEGALVRMWLAGGTLGAAELRDLLPGRSHYYIGSDPSKWRRDVPHYGKVVYRQVYPGVDLVFHGSRGQLEYDFVLAPGADWRQIELEFDGVEGIRESPEGDLVLRSAAGEIRHRRPLSYQETNGRRQAVPCRYVLKGEGRVAFEVGDYDRNRELVIDPVVEAYRSAVPVGTLSGSSTLGIAADDEGNAYVVGGVGVGLGADAFLARVKPDGSIDYISYFGGTQRDEARAVAVRWDGSKWVAYVTGGTRSPDFPRTGGFQHGPAPSTHPEDLVRDRVALAFFDAASGAPTLSTYFGGSVGYDGGRPWDVGWAIAVDDAGYVSLAILNGSMDFPVVNPISPHGDSGSDGYEDAVIMRLDPSGSGPVFSTYLRGSYVAEDTIPHGIATDASGNVYVAGLTTSGNFPVTEGAYDGSNLPGDGSGFLTKLSPAGELLYSTYLGGSRFDEALDVAVDGGGNAVVVGRTESTDFVGGQGKAFVLKLAPVPAAVPAYGMRRLSSSLSANGVEVDSEGNAYYAGYIGTFSSLTAYAAKLDAQGGVLWERGDPNPGGQATSADAWADIALGAPGDFFVAGRLSGELTVVRWTEPVPDRLEVVPPCTPGTLTAADSGVGCTAGTTRWKPQRDEVSPITVRFSGPSDLDLATVRLEVTPPPGFMGTYTPSTGPVTKLGGTEDEYKLEWQGPWTFSDASGTHPMPRGNYTLVVTAEREDSDQVLRSAPYDKVSLVEVKEIKFVALPGTPGPSPNTGPGEGDAIFPEAEAPGGAVGDRDQVQVITTIDPPITDLNGQPAVMVTFRSFDVDDPSATTEPVDFDGDGTPDFVSDNRFTPQSGLLRDATGAEVSGTLMVDIEANGATASTRFRVSPRQGDNYRVAASTSRQWLQELRAFQPSGNGEIRHESGRMPTADEGRQLSPMLTVWRTLHVEVDHLDSGTVLPSDLQVRGQISGLRPQRLIDKDARFITVASDPVNDHPYKNDWIGADLWPKDAAPPTSPPSGTRVKITGNGERNLDVSGAVDLTTLAAVGDQYRLKDDYWVDLTGGAPMGIAQRLLRDVYIDLRVLEAENATRALGFRRYLSSFDLITLQRDIRSAGHYWAIQVVSAFDGLIGDRKALPPRSGDNDPDPESGVLGQTGGSGPGLQQQDVLQPVCGIFNETIRDVTAENGWVSDTLGRVTAHEVICHGMQIGHSSGSDLCFASFLDGPAGEQLTPEGRAVLRALPQPALK